MQYSVVNLDKTIGTPNFRLDAEFYSPYYLESEQLVLSRDNDYLGNIISILTDYHANGSYEILRGNIEILDSPDYALMIRTIDLEKGDFENDVKYVSEHAYNFLKKTKVFGGEIIINKIGNAGKVYLVPTLGKKISLGMNQFMLRPKKNFDNYFLYVFLVCKYGRLLLEQRITGAVPLSIDKESVRSVPVPIFKKDFQEKIHELVEKHLSLSILGKNLYSQAEQLLLSELGLLDWKAKHELGFIKNFSDTAQSDRFDAEYFQPKYEEIIEVIEKYKGGFDSLENVLVRIDTGEYSSEYFHDQEGFRFYVRSLNIKNGLIEVDGNYFVDPSSFTKTLNEGDIVTPRVGTLGVFGVATDELTGSVYSDNILCFRLPGEFNPSVYVLYLNLFFNKNLIERLSRGSVQERLNQETLKSLVIPKLDSSIQKKAARKIEDSHNNRKMSQSLLETAKKGVELAIEKDETEAEKWIEDELQKLKITI